MNTVLYILIILLILFTIVVFLVSPATATAKQRAPFQNRNIAHRGLHTPDKSIPENSLAAFKCAVDAGYGIELDIQFTKDEQVVVFHDDTLNRVCGIDGRVDAYTYEELQNFSICQTGEKIPLFSTVLSLVDAKVPMIVELKNGPKNTLLCERSLEMLKAYNGEYCIESFQPAIVGWYKKHAPNILRGQLSASQKELSTDLPAFSAFVLANLLSNVYARPHFVAYHKEKNSILVKLSDLLGAMRVVWTVRDTDDITAIEKINDTVIFEFYKPEIKYTRS